MDIQRGQIWLVNLDPSLGAEIKKTRPALVISNNLNNQYAATITVLPITDRGEKVYPFEVFLPAHVSGLTKDSKIKCQQIRTVDKSRLSKSLGVITEEKWPEIHHALILHLQITI